MIHHVNILVNIKQAFIEFFCPEKRESHKVIYSVKIALIKEHGVTLCSSVTPNFESFSIKGFCFFAASIFVLTVA